MLPPPAPTLDTSVDSALMIRSCSISKVSLTNGAPSTTSETSVEVPPTSAHSRLPVPERGAEARARDRAGGRAGEDDAKRLLQRLAPGQQRRRAVGEVQLALEAQLAQVGVEARRVAPEDELHEDVDDRRRRARVLLGQRRGLRGDRDRDVVAQHLAGQLAQLLLVGRVDVGVEQADRHALHLAAAQHRELAARLVGVERAQLAAVGEHPLDHAAAQVARHERPGGVAERAPPGGVGLPVERAADRAAVEDVAEALGGEEGDLRQPARDDRVEPHRARVVEHRAALHPEAAGALDDRGRGRRSRRWGPWSPRCARRAPRRRP